MLLNSGRREDQFLLPLFLLAGSALCPDQYLHVCSERGLKAQVKYIEEGLASCQLFTVSPKAWTTRCHWQCAFDCRQGASGPDPDVSLNREKSQPLFKWEDLVCKLDECAAAGVGLEAGYIRVKLFCRRFPGLIHA